MLHINTVDSVLMIIFHIVIMSMTNTSKVTLLLSDQHFLSRRLAAHTDLFTYSYCVAGSFLVGVLIE